MKWRESLIRVAAILGLALVLGLAIPNLATQRDEQIDVYRNIETVNTPCSQGYSNPPAPALCSRPAGFTDKFRTAFLVLMIIAVGIFGATEFIPRNYKKDDPIFGRFSEDKRIIISELLVLQSPSKMLLISVCCLLIGLPLNFYLLRATFGDYIQLCLIVALLGYLAGFVFICLARLADISAIRSTRSSSPFNVNLTGLEASQVVDVMGIPVKVINLESKMIYVYKNIKVIFTDGRVTDVQ